jgi:hypothetical protein
MQVNKDKKISLKRQTNNNRKTELYLPIKEIPVYVNYMNSPRGYENIRRTWDRNVPSVEQVPNHITERHTYQSHSKSTLNRE